MVILSPWGTLILITRILMSIIEKVDQEVVSEEVGPAEECQESEEKDEAPQKASASQSQAASQERQFLRHEGEMVKVSC